MHRWFRISALFALVALSLFALAAVTPEDGAPTSAATPQKRKAGGLLQNLQELVEQQSKQIELQSKQIEALGKQVDAQNQGIESLNRQFAHLTELLESLAAHSVAAPPAPASPAAPALPPAAPVAETTPSASASPESSAVTQNPALPNPGAPTHVVKKGENLISIAHHYGTTVSELLKLNKISDERKLQIGQTLMLPIPANAAGPAPAPASSPVAPHNP